MPVWIGQRDGPHMPAAEYALRNVMPCAASFSTFGLWRNAIADSGSSGLMRTDVPNQGLSSTRIEDKIRRRDGGLCPHRRKGGRGKQQEQPTTGVEFQHG